MSVVSRLPSTSTQTSPGRIQSQSEGRCLLLFLPLFLLFTPSQSAPLDEPPKLFSGAGAAAGDQLPSIFSPLAAAHTIKSDPENVVVVPGVKNIFKFARQSSEEASDVCITAVPCVQSTPFRIYVDYLTQEAFSYSEAHFNSIATHNHSANSTPPPIDPICTTVPPGRALFHVNIMLIGPRLEVFQIFFTQGTPKWVGLTPPTFKPALSRLDLDVSQLDDSFSSDSVLFCAVLSKMPNSGFDTCSLRRHLTSRKLAEDTPFQIRDLPVKHPNFVILDLFSRETTYDAVCSRNKSHSLPFLENDQKYQMSVFGIALEDGNADWNSVVEFPLQQILAVVPETVVHQVESEDENFWTFDLVEPHYNWNLTVPEYLDPWSKTVVLAQPDASDCLPVQVRVFSEGELLDAFTIQKYHQFHLGSLPNKTSQLQNKSLTILFFHKISGKATRLSVAMSDSLDELRLPLFPNLPSKAWNLQVISGLRHTIDWTEPRSPQPLEQKIIVSAFYRAADFTNTSKLQLLDVTLFIAADSTVTQTSANVSAGCEFSLNKVSIRRRIQMQFKDSNETKKGQINCYSVQVGFRKRDSNDQYVFMNEALIDFAFDNHPNR